MAANAGSTNNRTDTEDSNNTDNSVEVEAEEGGMAANGGSTNNRTETEVEAEAYNGGIAAANGNATDNSIEEQINIGDVAVNVSVLSGSVSGNNVNLNPTGGPATESEKGDGANGNGALARVNYKADNTIRSSYNGFAGQSLTVQNTGLNSMVQQQVSFQGNINANQGAAGTP
jgi:hypothetical protein